MYCVHARKSASGVPRTHFRACKISKFPGGVPPDSPPTIHFVGPPFLHLPWAPPILSAALCTMHELDGRMCTMSLWCTHSEPKAPSDYSKHAKEHQSTDKGLFTTKITVPWRTPVYWLVVTRLLPIVMLNVAM